MIAVYSSPLLARVQQLVLDRPASLQMGELAAEIGVSPQWLSTFAHGKAGNPSAVVIEKIYVRLTGKQLIRDE